MRRLTLARRCARRRGARRQRGGRRRRLVPSGSGPLQRGAHDAGDAVALGIADVAGLDALQQRHAVGGCRETPSSRVKSLSRCHIVAPSTVQNQPIGAGEVSEVTDETGEVKRACRKETVQEQTTRSLEETGWRQGRARAWLWVAVSTWVPVCGVRRARGGQGARERWGETVDGMVVSDRWSGDHGSPGRWRQGCWAHLLRAIDAMSARGDGSQAIGASLQSLAQQLVHGWHRVRDGTRTRARFRSDMRPVRRECARVLEAGSRGGVATPAGGCRALRKRREALGTFGHLDGVEPPNNAAERAMRPGVLWRQQSVGTHRAHGSRCVEAIMTVVATLQQQHRNPLDELTAACEATLRDETVPSLLPTFTPEHQGAV
jgi:transposase